MAANPTGNASHQRRRQYRPPMARELIDSIREFSSASGRLEQAIADGMGINLTATRCLDALERLGRTSAGELARELGVTTGAVTGIVDRLEKLGYVRRIRDEGDRRRVLVEITDAAFERTREYWGPGAERFDSWVGELSEEQIRFLTEYNRFWVKLVDESLLEEA